MIDASDATDVDDYSAGCDIHHVAGLVAVCGDLARRAADEKTVCWPEDYIGWDTFWDVVYF